jgi:site-specific DNA-cytosine methylase
MAIKILIGGSPCTYWSVAKGENRETTAEGMGWELFKNYLVAKEKFKPDYFLYENNKSAAQPIKDQISSELGVELMYINSALVSAQNRQRFYAINWKAEQPQDRGILLQDILESGKVDRDKSLCLARRYAGFTGSQSYMCRRYFGKSFGQAVFEGDIQSIKNKWIENPYFESDERNIRPLSPIECERLQTLPDNYTQGFSETIRKEAIGNGWTAEVIKHLLSYANIPLDEEIIVLSLYDGIATGRYVLDDMGYKNVQYYAYEINPNAMAIANKNYPDIIQCGDAFAVREDDWKAPQSRSEWLDELLGA